MLHEDVRPQTFAGFIGNEKARRVAESLVKRSRDGDKPLAIWIDGPSGTGKTTLANIIANELGTLPHNIQDLNAQKLNAEKRRDIEYSATTYPMGGGWRAIIINEAHAMPGDAVQWLLTMLENLGKRTVVIFTTTEGRKVDIFGGFDAPLKSRCIGISLTGQGLAQSFADHACRVAETLGLGGIDAKRAYRIVQEEKNNLRSVLCRVESGDFLAGSEGSDSELSAA
jgi:replication-associated recombination protein RarA